MSEQIIILLFLIVAVSCTIYLYFWKAKKEIQYRKDERWQQIQLRANTTANAANYILVLAVAVGEAVSLFAKIDVSIPLNRVFLYVILFLGLRNAIELFSLLFFDKRM